MVRFDGFYLVLIKSETVLDAFWRYSQTIRPPGSDIDLTTADPLDPEVQRRIERLIR